MHTTSARAQTRNTLVQQRNIINIRLYIMSIKKKTETKDILNYYMWLHEGKERVLHAFWTDLKICTIRTDLITNNII